MVEFVDWPRTRTKLTRGSHELTQQTHTDSHDSHGLTILTRTHTDSHPLTCRWWEDWREILSQTIRRACPPSLTGVGAIVVFRIFLCTSTCVVGLNRPPYLTWYVRREPKPDSRAETT
jgi:hypothetical protein